MLGARGPGHEAAHALGPNACSIERPVRAMSSRATQGRAQSPKTGHDAGCLKKRKRDLFVRRKMRRVPRGSGEAKLRDGGGLRCVNLRVRP